MKHIIFTLFVCLIGGLVLAETCTASICDTKDTEIFFGNGIRTTEKKAFDSRNIIKQRLKTNLTSEEFERLAFNLAYNDTYGMPLDLLETTVQLLTGNVSRFWRLFWGLEVMPDWFAGKLILLSTALDKTALVTSDSLWKHVKTYQNTIAEGRKVVLVAHSQGSLFGNMAYNHLTSREKQSLGMVAVANVDNNVLGGGEPYTTLVSDKVISALRAAQFALPTRPMPPNTENSEEPEDYLGHGFVESYMTAGSVSSGQIVQQIITAVAGLTTPPKIVDSGIITVSLTWGSAPDVDLHVYEPNGSQVYWYNLAGYSGFLDRDDRSGYGPEHYNVPTCETLEPGIYHVALDYYEGDSPEVAAVQIEAGMLVRTYEVSMENEYFGTPNYPVPVASIWVKNGEYGGYDFEIYR